MVSSGTEIFDALVSLFIIVTIIIIPEHACLQSPESLRDAFSSKAESGRTSLLKFLDLRRTYTQQASCKPRQQQENCSKRKQSLKRKPIAYGNSIPKRKRKVKCGEEQTTFNTDSFF